MGEILILYESKTGHTKRYAQWVAEDVNAALFPLKHCNDQMIKKADLIVFGGGVNGSIINGQSRFEKRMRKYPDKKIICFATGIRPVTERTKELIQKNNFGKEEVTWFYFRGGLDTNKLTPGDKTLIRIYCAMLKRQRNIHEEDKEVLKCFQQDADYMTREQIQPLVRKVCEMFKKIREGEEYEQKRAY